MSHRLLLASVIVPALSTAAFAQGAPGDCDDCVVVASAPAPAVVVSPAVELSHRLGVGLQISSLAIANHDDPNADPTELGGGGLQVRYRLTPRWELELGVSTLREHDADGMPTGPEMHAAELGAMFHMRPGHRWDWYLLGAVGGLHEGNKHDDAHQGRAMAQLGVGIEHRWNRFGLGLEVRAVGIAPDDMADRGDTTAPPASTSARLAGSQPPPPPPPPATEADKRGDAGGQVTFGATYYF